MQVCLKFRRLNYGSNGYWKQEQNIFPRPIICPITAAKKLSILKNLKLCEKYVIIKTRNLSRK